jgi:hydrogenase expression/formation protein HypD
MFRFRDRDVARRIERRLRAMRLDLRLMHVCGTHQDTLVRHGLDGLLRGCGVIVRQGPGCPVCVTTTREYEEAMALARAGVVLTTFGDAAQVPGARGSLLDLRSEGCDVRVVYGIGDAVQIARKLGRDTVFLGVGFETTAPSTAVTVQDGLPENCSILCCHRYMPPALDALLGMGEFKLQGLIEPGHVSAIIGLRPYEILAARYGVPQVVAGFEPLDLLMAVYMLARQVTEGVARVENEYSRVVRYEGNVKALRALDAVFEPVDLRWRGFPSIPRSGMQFRAAYAEMDARKVHEDRLRNVEVRDHDAATGCRCDEVLRGLIESRDCPLFERTCAPSHPVGPCMVSVEGSCNIAYRYGRRLPVDC